MSQFLMPAEWERHQATWIAWPYLESDFPGKIDAVRWAYLQFVRNVAAHERVEIVCASPDLAADCKARLAREQITGDIELRVLPYHRTWLRDSAPTAVRVGKEIQWIGWHFNAWAKYDDVNADAAIAGQIAALTHRPLVPAMRPDNQAPAVLEGGAFDVDGAGTVLVTRECLLSDTQVRNPGLTQQGYEQLFKSFLGAPQTVWLEAGCEGDDTHGHIDDIARFVRPGVVALAMAAPADGEQYKVSCRNREILESARTASGSKLEVVPLPYPSPRFCDGVRLPASYLNFYFANDLLLVPTFNDPQDRVVLNALADLMPERTVVGINCTDWILGYGTLHCSTQQQPV